MKKTLLTCVALSAFCALPVLAQTTDVQPTQTAAAPSIATISSAIEIGLLSYGFDADTAITVTQNGSDFIITVPPTQMRDNTGKEHDFPATQINMTRVADFGSHAQYKMENITLPYIKTVLSTFYPQSQITEKSFSEEVFWVPDLSLRTKQSLKGEEIHVSVTPELQIALGSVFSDSLTQAKGPDTMDMAGSLDINNLVIDGKLFKLMIPRLLGKSQVLDSAQTADAVRKTLSAAFSSTRFSIPEMSLTAKSPLFAPVKMRSDLNMETTQDAQTNEMDMHLTLDNTLLNLNPTDFETGALPALFPETIKVDATLTQLNAKQLLSILQKQEQLDNSLDEDTPQSITLQQEIEQQITDALGKVQLNIAEITLQNPIAGIKITGTARFVDQLAQFNGQLAITNFDLISPDYQAQCAAEKEKQPKTDKQPAVPSEPMVCSKGGIFDPLRPYLASATQTTVDGKPVTTFSIEYKNDQIFLNNQPFVSLQETESEPATKK